MSAPLRPLRTLIRQLAAALANRTALSALVAVVAITAGPAAPAAAQACPDGRPWDLAVPAGDAVQEVLLRGGVTYIGRVVDTGDPVGFELASGDVLQLEHERIVCIRAARGRMEGAEFWPRDPNTTRLFFGPTGRALPRGEGYLSVFELFMPFVAVGFTDRFTMAAGTPLFLTSSGIEVLWLAPKFEVARTPSFRGSVGALAFFAPGESESVGVLYGVGTFGRDTDRAVTLGAGWGYSSDSGIHEAPALMAGFEARSSARIKWISENYFFPEDGFGILSFGPRFFGERLSADLGLAMPVGVDEFFAFPLINFVWNW